MASGQGFLTPSESQISDLCKINDRNMESTLKNKERDKPKRIRKRVKNKNIGDDNNEILDLVESNSPRFRLPIVRNKLPLDYCIPSSSKHPYSMDKASTYSSNKLKDVVSKKSVSVDEKVTFEIQSIRKHVGCQMIRKRNYRYKHINLRSFTKNTNTEHCIFTTVLNNLLNNFHGLTMIDKEKNKIVSKAESRKYPKQESIKKKIKRENRDIEAKETTFPDYISQENAVSGLRDGDLVKGVVRINPKNSQDSYVSNDDSSKADYYLTSVLDRNRALEGDEVILQMKPKNEWVDGKITVQVVYITQKVHSRLAVGILKARKSKNAEYAIFHPRDKRIPSIRIPESHWPNGFKDDPKKYANILCMAKILRWTVPSYASGVLTENLGLVGDLKVETLSILKEFCLDTTPFGEEVREYLPQSFHISKEEIERREDIRKECVFTIDPATARDLDDAVSVKILTNGNYEVGVHISDVSYYLEQGSELDQIVSKKATTIYMVDSVYHMLPVELCLHCSLLPGEDKLAFSVFWEITKDGEILSKRYTRTIINSCSKLAYEHAQEIIENPDKKFSDSDFPEIHNGFRPEDIVNTVNVLQNIAVIFREKRIMNGALKIDQVKLYFTLDAESGKPVDYSKYENKESHRLIEEFMLLANISVAEKIYEAFPDMAFLRCHEKPKQTMLVDLQNSLATYGIHIDISSSSGLRSSLEKYISNDYPGLCRAAVLNHLTAKAMTRARYFCAATTESECFNHYALSVPIYTHYTSPIRRYADIMVHRLLAASLSYQDPPAWDEPYISAMASNCNMQKYNAKRAGEASMELYLGHFIENHKPFEQDCVVVDVKERNFDVIVLKTGSIVRIYPNNCEQGTQWKTEHIVTSSSISKDRKAATEESCRKQLRLTITFPKTNYFPRSKITVEMFSLVKVNLEKKQNTYKLEGTLVRPLPERVFTRQT
ncbi:unnamed protein product [Phaedon cochleariae]|uniref:RNB domain-containing protein n=1 Tax=Phaedon cochleariae TaxID=80249 RepID=A0A9N9SAE4_PHACE|nr:unnamed protein product [Phaedon cochleariae]